MAPQIQTVFWRYTSGNQGNQLIPQLITWLCLSTLELADNGTPTLASLCPELILPNPLHAIFL
jgi:hypothetical protein